jgi:iron complex outermembrane receptor protein
MKRRLRLLGGIAFATLGLSATSAAAVVQAASGAAPASTSDQGVGVAEIIVTAQKRSERIQDVPAAIQATQGRELQNRQITSNDQLMLIVPDLRVTSATAGLGQDITIRGVGPANNYNLNVLEPVGLYMDEIYQSFTTAPGTQLFDLARVEVLKGPQGTLYGRNTTGGAVNYITQKPGLSSSDNNGDIEAGYGNYDRIEVQGASDVTLIDHVLGARVAVFHTSRDGYIDNIAPTGPRSFDSDNTIDGRLLLRYAPTEHFDATFGVYVNHFTGTGPAALAYGIYPNDTSVAPAPIGFSRAGLGNYQTSINFYPGLKSDSSDFGLTLNWDLGQLKLTSISSFEHSSGFVTNDCDSTPLDICESAIRTSSSQASQDLRAAYTAGRLHLIVGLSYGWDTFGQVFNVGFGGAEFLSNIYRQERTTYGAYFDSTYDITDQLKLTLGFRDTQDATTMSRVHTDILDSIFGSPIGQTIPLLPSVTAHSNGPTGRVIVSYKIVPEVMAYVSYSRGYRAGAFNGVQFASARELNYVKPETDDDVEVGVKASLGRRLTADIDFFNIQLANQQVQGQINIPGCPACTPPTPAISYAALRGLDGYSRGVDLDLRAQFLDSLVGTVTLTWLNTRYDSGPNQSISGTSVAGKHFPFAPDVSLRAGLDWTAWQEGDQKLTASGDVGYTGQYWFDPVNGANEVPGATLMRRGQPGYATVDARLAYEFGRFRVAAWVNNMFDQFYLAGASNTEASFGDDQALPGAPRTFGVTVGAKF